MRLTDDRRVHFMPDAPRGGGDGDDPHDRDDYLAACFKLALSRSLSTCTPNPPHLLESVDNIMGRVEQVGRLLMLLSKDLQPIARTLLEISYPSDRHNPDILAWRFRHMDLRIDSRRFG